MQIDQAIKLYEDYSGASISNEIHPSDQMKTEWDGYKFVGRSAVNIIFESLILSKIKSVTRVMDFGCGYGRVARHLPAFFPSAKIYYSDIMQDMVDFCSGEFGGEPVLTNKDLNSLDIPGDFDVIWVGSVFTHFDYPAMALLMDKLYASLSDQGLLIATFAGRTVAEIQKIKPTFKEEQLKRLFCSFEDLGVGYENYRHEKGLICEGQSLIAPERIYSLVSQLHNARIVLYSEAGWANRQDVIAVSKSG